MNLEISGVAERLAQEFPGLPAGVVMRTVCECADACECAGALFIEQAARARLGAAGAPSVPPEHTVAPAAQAAMDAMGADPAAGPVAGAVAESVAGPVLGPVAGPVLGPVAGRVAEPVAGPVDGQTADPAEPGPGDALGAV